MALKEPILKILAKTYEPGSLIDTKFGRYDLSFKTDEEGRPILLFIGTRSENGDIVGDRYSRRLKIEDGKIVKDHWELKGKATAR